jgi:alkanesulfonate monooxygenase SsuD/methylene tetrahydromethanopterin reductase-like flavin-dependent oxidoreductase (luciferase family)
MPEMPRCAVGVPNVGPFGDPLLLVDLAVAAEEHGWDGFFVWDHLLYQDPSWHVADPLVVITAVAARTARIKIAVMVNVLARRRVGKVARESVTLDMLSGGRLIVGAGLGRCPLSSPRSVNPGTRRCAPRGWMSPCSCWTRCGLVSR